MPTPDPTPRRRRLTLATDDDRLRDELRTLLAGHDIDVDLVSEEAKRDDPDVVVVRATDVGPDDERLGSDDSGVVVVGTPSPTEEADLVASGASAVLSDSLGDAEFREQLLEIADAEARGGLHGPDAGGIEAEPRLADFQSRSPRMRDFVDLVRRIAATDSTLLVTGETGVGKERLARAIHAESERSKGPFVSVNCGALPDNLLESELFGHERGAFTGATTSRKGRFEEADGGTLFLDEIGEMPTQLQVKLLTVLQSREVRRLGSESPHRVDVRILSATNRDLSEEIAAGNFREDLYFRLNVVALEIPPLRARLEDVPGLVGRFVRHFAEVHDRPDVTSVEPDAMAQLLDYDWPGNVRELVNVIERAVLLTRGQSVALADLPTALRGGGTPPGDAPATTNPELFELSLAEARQKVLDDFELRYLTHHLQATGGAVGETASRASINPRTLYEKMRRHGLRKEDYA